MRMVCFLFCVLLQIFTEDTPEIESLPRKKVLEYLENLSRGNKNNKEKDLPIRYLVSSLYYAVCTFLKPGCFPRKSYFNVIALALLLCALLTSQLSFEDFAACGE